MSSSSNRKYCEHVLNDKHGNDLGVPGSGVVPGAVGLFGPTGVWGVFGGIVVGILGESGDSQIVNTHPQSTIRRLTEFSRQG